MYKAQQKAKGYHRKDNEQVLVLMRVSLFVFFLKIDLFTYLFKGEGEGEKQTLS